MCDRVAGEIRMQWQDEHDTWWAEVAYRTAEDHSSTIDAFPAARVRKDETDYSVRRSVHRFS